ncbi:MAG: uridine kinase [Bacteriovoracales bacterium]|nr:uridine kinase [Bacteriovoracales bacterium]
MIIGVAGGSGSGKTTFSKLLAQKLGEDSSFILYQDRYYIDLSEQFDCDGGAVNFDHPSSIDFSLMAVQIQELRLGNSIQVPRYDFVTHSRQEEIDHVKPHGLIIIDGILILSQEIIRRCLDFSIYIDACEEYRFERRLLRDVRERGRSPDGIKRQINTQVKPMHDLFVEPSKNHADFIIENNGNLDELSQKVDRIIHQNQWESDKLPTSLPISDSIEIQPT